MIHKKSFLRTALLAALLGGAALTGLRAQDADHGPRPPHGPPPSPLFDALDTNHDGVISAEEIANASTSLKALLKDGATQLTREDVRPPHPTLHRGDTARPHPQDADGAEHPPRPEADADDAQGPAHPGDRAEHRHHGPPPSPLFDALDTNHDGVISAEEIAAAPDALKKLDKSGTGQIKREDVMHGPPAPPHDRE